MINSMKYCQKLIQKYIREYPNLSPDLIADIVDEVIIQVPNMYFNYELIQQHQEFCRKCGVCCRTLNCKYFDGKECLEWVTRPHVCSEFPLYDNGEVGLITDPGCRFAVKMAEFVLDKKIKEYGEI